jgi:predicted nucleotidyltransferase component of viral defense system
MDQFIAESLSKKIRIAKEPIVREEYEMIFLQVLLACKFHKKLIFKGGTALRLAYGSPRFSEDLDFSLLDKIKSQDFFEIIRKTVKDLPMVSIKELTEKHYTHFAILKIKEPYLRQPFPLKIEISKRPVAWKEKSDYVSHGLKSQLVPLEAVSFVATLERAFRDKKKMIKERDKARDLFDLWWLGRNLSRKVKLNFKNSEIKKIRGELNQFLPEPMRLVVESWRQP